MRTNGGLYRWLLDPAGEVNHAAWLRARAEGEAVGDCRRCPGELRPEPPEERGYLGTDYEATCLCGYVMLAPGARVMRGSALWSAANGAGRVAQLRKQRRPSDGEVAA